MRGLRPDFKTIADFRKNNRTVFKALFKQFNLLCRQMGLFAAELVAIDGSQRVPLASERIVIGRDTDCDLHLPSSQVSSRHCELTYDGVHWRVIDLNSKNGIQVNGESTTDRQLQPGDRLSIARQHHYHLEYAAPRLDSGWILRWVLAGAIAFALSLTGLYL